MKTVVTIGTRGSKMALTQAAFVQKLFAQAHPEIETVVEVIRTTSDVVKGSLKNVGGKGAFVREIDLALVEGKIDLAINCMKDIPGDHERTEGVSIMAVLAREASEDVLVCRKEMEEKNLPSTAHFGTCSPRRAALLQRLYPGCHVSLLRGNVDTRLGKLDAGEFDGIILAKAGLFRLGVEERITKTFTIEEMLPAVGQGILTLDGKSNNDHIRELLQKLNHTETFAMMTAERALLRTLKGNCHTAIAGISSVEHGRLTLRAQVMSPDGKEQVEAVEAASLQEAEALGMLVGQRLLDQGAESLMGKE